MALKYGLNMLEINDDDFEFLLKDEKFEDLFSFQNDLYNICENLVEKHNCLNKKQRKFNLFLPNNGFENKVNKYNMLNKILSIREYDNTFNKSLILPLIKSKLHRCYVYLNNMNYLKISWEKDEENNYVEFEEFIDVKLNKEQLLNLISKMEKLKNKPSYQRCKIEFDRFEKCLRNEINLLE